MGPDLSLALTAAWPAGRIAAALVTPAGVREAVGDTGRPFALASVTKPLTALAALVAVEEGTLDLDEPAGPPGSTVRHLLAHTSGLGFAGGVVAEPGRRRIYSNAGFDALGEHLARRAGMPAVAYITAAVCEPLGMAATTFPDGSVAAGAHASVDDLVGLAGELLRPRLIDPSTLAAATTVAFPGLDGVLPGYGKQTPNDWGLGLEIRGHKEPHWTGATNSPRTFGHFGRSGTFLWVDPAIDAALIVLTDEPFGDWARDRWPELSDAVVAEVTGTGASGAGQ